MAENGFRIEYDSMGEVRVPANAKWQAQTQRAVENFPISARTIHPWLIAALGSIKGASAEVNGSMKVIDKRIAQAISEAAAEVAAGKWNGEFPVDVFQTGSGTSSNMNANEVIASLASAKLDSPVHPNDDVNASQSSNDVFPTAIHLAAAKSVTTVLIPSLEHLSATLRKKQKQFAKVVKSGRTHLMDATPVTLGQEFGGYATAIDLGIERLQACLPRVCEVPLGGTAVGTGINCPKGFAKRVLAIVSERNGVTLTEARDHFEAHSSRNALTECSGAMRTIALSLYKMANDLRWMGSGPRCGLAEIRLPDLQPGSSIMPGKVNPVVPEAVCQVVAQVIGNDASVAFGDSAGSFELNVMLPVIGRNILESIELLASVSRAFADKCVVGIEANVERCRDYAESSPSLGTSLNPYIGYEKAGEVIKESMKTGRAIRELVLERGWMSDAELDKALDPLRLTKGGIVK